MRDHYAFLCTAASLFAVVGAAATYADGARAEPALCHTIQMDDAPEVLWPARHDFACGGECHDFATGGGWIQVGEDHANFGFNAGYHDGEPQPVVHFNYIDHSTGMHMQATGITVYAMGNTSNVRHMEGTCDIDEVSGFTYVIDIEDNGEPGRGVDFLSISLSNGYSASDTLSGGNIQFHGDCD